jgi:hypothetical protein
MIERKFALSSAESQEVLQLENERDDAARKSAAARQKGDARAAAVEDQRAARAVARIKEIYIAT